MGHLIKVKASEIIPSQDFVKESTIGYILKCIVRHEEDKLPPTPIVRKKPDGSRYIAIDGHNLIIIYDLLERDCEVYLAEAPNDRLIELPKSSPDAIARRNEDLAQKYDKVIEDAIQLKNKGISSFKELRKRFPYLSSLDSAKKHYNLK